MAMLDEIPYLDHATITGRFLSCLTFYDEGDWHFWMLAGEPGEQRLFKMKGWPAEAVYFAREPVEASDLYLPSIDFTGRIACYSEVQKAVGGIRDDIFNLSASLAKLELLQGSKEQIPHGLSRMATTEVEYIVLVCRSLFDLFQEILVKLWNRVQLLDGSIQRRSNPAPEGRNRGAPMLPNLATGRLRCPRLSHDCEIIPSSTGRSECRLGRRRSLRG